MRLKNLKTSLRITNYKTDLYCTFEPLSKENSISHENLVEIASICNERFVYDFLFKERLNSQPYTLKDAQNFVKWSEKGWDDWEYFVYIVKDQSGHICAALDIKSNNIEEAEIGYWCSSEKSGIMTNALSALVTRAQRAGFRKLFANVNVDNLKSIRLLKRLSFCDTDVQLGNKKQFEKFLAEI